ncbi:hypothetical protein Hanom_Chr12g01150641 [Helianthus anomalus]
MCKCDICYHIIYNVDVQSRGKRISVFNRLNGGVPTSKPVEGSVGPGNHLRGKNSYSSVVNPISDVSMAKIDLPPMNTEDLRYFNVLTSPEEAEEFRYNKVNEWEKWFSRLYLWEGIPPLIERITRIKVLGIPISLWDGHVINKIGERCGRLLVKSEAESSDGNMAEDRLAILVNTGKRIASEFNLVWKGQVIPA